MTQETIKSEPKEYQKIAVISGSRAESGLLFGLMHCIQNHPRLELQIFLTGSHLESQFGATEYEFKQQQLVVTDRIPLTMNSSDKLSKGIAVGEGVSRFSQSFSQHQPDLIVVLGDRFEILSAVSAALMLNIPIAHLHGGELTLGAIDDRIRHAISKLAHIHFPATTVYAKRIVQMGESPQRVFSVGATAIDNIYQTQFINRQELEQYLGLKLDKPTVVITWHPETVHENSLSGLKDILAACETFPAKQFIITKANADAGGLAINQYLDKYVEQHSQFHLYDSLGNQRYLSLLAHIELVLGNSSSALLEVAAMRVASVNVGCRQDGRYKPDSVIDCSAKSDAIKAAIKTATTSAHQQKCQQMELPYGEGNSAQKITEIIAQTPLSSLLYKPFYDIDFDFP